MLRREFLRAAPAAAGIGLGLSGCGEEAKTLEKKKRYPAFLISLAQYSLHRRIWKRNGEEPLDPLDFARTARGFGIWAIEYVSMLWREEFDAKGDAYLKEMRKRADDLGVTGLLIMIDREGMLGDADKAKRSEAVANHERWLEAAAMLGCRSIRVDPKCGGDSYDESLKLMADGLNQLCEKALAYRMNVLVENESGIGANANWLVDLMKRVNHPLAGMLPDFGNFWTDPEAGELADPYDGIRKLMPWARAVSAKSYGFANATTNITKDNRDERPITLDLAKMLRIVSSSGYNGYIGIEYEGQGPEMAGIEQTKRVLDRLSYR